MDESKKVDWKILVQIVLAVVVFGWGWFADNQEIVIAFAATVLASLFSVWIVGKFWMTFVVFGVAVVLQLLFTPVALPTFPGWDIALLVTYLGQWFEVVQSVMLSAMVIYNTLLSRVLGNTTDFIKKYIPASLLPAKK